MMKWGRKKPSLSSLSSSSRLASFSHVFPISWLSKFKQMSANSGVRPTKVKRKGKQNSPSVSTHVHGSCNDGRFYGGDGDDFWRLSFGEESVRGRESRGGLRSVWYDSDDEVEILPSSCPSCRSSVMKVAAGTEETWKFSNMVSDMRKMRELHGNVKELPNIGTCEGEKGRKEAELKTPREVVRDRKLRKTNRKILEEKWLELGRNLDKAEEISPKTEEKDILELEPVQTVRTTVQNNSKSKASSSRKDRYVSSMNSKNSNLRTIKEDCVFAAPNLEETERLSAEELSSEWKKLKDMKIKELMSKGEKQRKSVYVSMDSQRRRLKQGNKVRVYSPRTPSKVEVCKIKALEDMKKAKRKMKMAKEKTEEVSSALESFAVVKCSFDPQQDFRDSMVEMILEKRIRQPEELEELLACYLTLNSDQYHDLIIKVFRQVWFDLNQPCFDPELQNEHCCYD